MQPPLEKLARSILGSIKTMAALPNLTTEILTGEHFVEIGMGRRHYEVLQKSGRRKTLVLKAPVSGWKDLVLSAPGKLKTAFLCGGSL